MPARSNLQQAVPITFGFKMARLLATLKRHRARLAEIRPRIEVFCRLVVYGRSFTGRRRSDIRGAPASLLDLSANTSDGKIAMRMVCLIVGFLLVTMPAQAEEMAQMISQYRREHGFSGC